MTHGRTPGQKNPKYRARTRIRRANDSVERVKEDLEVLYEKPVEEWDFEELQKGCARKPDGSWPTSNHESQVVTDVMRQEARRRLGKITRDKLGAHAGQAITTFADLMTDDRTDDNGRPITPSSVKLQAATYILDQIIGKPTAHVEVEGAVQVQHMLANVLVNPDGSNAHGQPTMIEGEQVDPNWYNEDDVDEDDEL